MFERFITVAALLAAAFGLLGSTQAEAAKDFFGYVSPDPIGVNAFLERGKTGIRLLLRSTGPKCRLTKAARLPPAAKMLKRL